MVFAQGNISRSDTPALVFAHYCSQHIAIENNQRQPRMNCVSVESSRNHPHQVERWYSEDALSAMSHCTNPRHLASLDQGTPEPPLISVEICEVCRTDMCCRGFLHPSLGNDLATIRISAIQNELANLCEVPRAQSQAAHFENPVLEILRPCEVSDTEGLKQKFARDVIECPASRLSKDSLQKQSTTTVVVPDLSRRRHNRLFERVPTS